MKTDFLNSDNSYSYSPKTLLVGDIPIRETTAKFSNAHVLVLVGSFNYTTEDIFQNYVEDAELTQLCMQISEKSLSIDWEKENDERWNQFLND